MEEKIAVSVVIPAFNEEASIGATIESVRAALNFCGRGAEIIVVDNCSTDATAEIARGKGAMVVSESHRQIARARNAGARAARGRFLVFVDADTLIDRRLILEAVGLLESGRVVGGGALVGFAAPLKFFAAFLLRFWQGVSRAARLAAGCFVFCEASAFFVVGGFDEQVYASEELKLSFRLRAHGVKRGRKFVIINQPWVHTSPRKNSQTGLLLLTMMIFAVFPMAVRIRSLCFLWYGCRIKN